MRNRLLFTLIILICAATLLAAAQRDGAVIANSGSTNTAGFTIAVWSDGTSNVSMHGDTAAPRAVTLSGDLATRFFNDLRAAREENAPAQHCMKSASFGTRTTVTWHGWSSPDLQCPPLSGTVGALAADVSAIEAAAGVGQGAPHRIGLPPSVRKNPPTTPEAQPT